MQVDCAGKLGAVLKSEPWGGAGRDKVAKQGGSSSETWDGRSAGTALMGLQQKQPGPRLQVWAPCGDQSSGKRDLVPCPSDVQLSLQAGRCLQWGSDGDTGRLSQHDIL